VIPVIDRVVEQYDVLHNFFVKGKFDVKNRENACFKRILVHLQDKKSTLFHILFVRNLSRDFECFLLMFQDSSPLIHQLHNELTDLMRRLLLCFVKRELIADKSAGDLVHVVQNKLSADNYLSADKINVDYDCRKIVNEFKTDNKLYSTYKMTYHYILKLMETCTTHLVKKLPLSNVLLKNLAYLSSLVLKHPLSVQMIGAVVACLPHLNSDKIKDDVLHEWQTYQEDVMPDDMYIYEQGQTSDGTAYIKYRRLNEYWYTVMQLTDT